MSEPKDPSTDDEGGERSITARRLVPFPGVTTRTIAGAVRAAAGGHEVRSISVAVVSDAHISELHDRYLGDPDPTDVMAFDLRDEPGTGPLEGEIVVSGETAAREAARLGVERAEELLRYVIHGTLHLVGYDDKTADGRRRMRREENRVLASLRQRRADANPTAAKGRKTGSV